MSITAYHHLSLEEFLRIIDEKRQYSPIIEELCLRLETTKKNEDAICTNFDCPVCEAQMHVDVDLERQTLTVVKGYE